MTASALQFKSSMLFLILLAATIGLPSAAHSQEPTVVFLVRHAEKVDSSNESTLTSEGFERAKALAKMLQDAKLKHVYSTDFVRTKETAQPVATQNELEVEVYNPREPKSLVAKMKTQGGRHLVVGHSNTTPQLVKLLGGDPGSPIEESEYDRLYIVTIGCDGIVSTLLVRFGA